MFNFFLYKKMFFVAVDRGCGWCFVALYLYCLLFFLLPDTLFHFVIEVIHFIVYKIKKKNLKSKISITFINLSE